METSEFLSIARSQISSDPRSRLSPLVKQVIESPDCVIDIHAHIFDKKCLTVGYILLRLLKSKITEILGLEATEDSILAKNEEEIYNYIADQKPDTSEEWQQLEDDLTDMIELTETAEIFGFDLKEAFRVLKKQSMLEVLDYYLDKLSVIRIPGYENRPLVTGILLMDLETGWGIKPETDLFQQIREIMDIMPHRPIVPFLPLDPRRAGLAAPRENLYELFLHAFTDPVTPFFGVKCYPGLGYFPHDLRLDPVFEICAEKNIPVTTHCGGEIVSTFGKEIELHETDGVKKFPIPGETRAERARYLNDPGLWIPVLNKHKGLKLNFGHFGGDTSWEDQSRSGNNERISRLIHMMQNPGWRVFADFSFNIVENELFDAFRKTMDDHPGISGKVMFGTDYWVVLPAGDLLGKQQEFLEQMKTLSVSLLHSAPSTFLIS